MKQQELISESSSSSFFYWVVFLVFIYFRQRLVKNPISKLVTTWPNNLIVGYLYNPLKLSKTLLDNQGDNTVQKPKHLITLQQQIQ